MDFYDSNLTFLTISEDLDSIRKPVSNGEPNKVIRVNDIIGNSLKRIGTYKNLDNKQQVVALIDDVSRLVPFFLNFNEIFFRIYASTAENAT